MAEYTKEGHFGKFILGNITLGQKASLFWAIGAGRFLQTAGLFLLGMLIGRKQLFVNTKDNTRFWIKSLIIAPYCGYTISLIIGFTFFLFQVRFCKWWLKNHKQGPLESLWHRLTWL